MRTGDGRPLPQHLKRRIVREIDRLELLREHIKVVKAERDARLAAAREAAILNPATMLIELKGIGPDGPSNPTGALSPEAQRARWDHRTRSNAMRNRGGTE